MIAVHPNSILGLIPFFVGREVLEILRDSAVEPFTGLGQEGRVGGSTLPFAATGTNRTAFQALACDLSNLLGLGYLTASVSNQVLLSSSVSRDVIVRYG